MPGLRKSLLHPNDTSESLALPEQGLKDLS